MASSTLPSTLSTYIPIEKLTTPSFSAYTYANDLVTSVNASNTGTSAAPSTNPADSLVDITTPLQKTLFDLQEIDTSIHTLTSRSALDILTYTQRQNATAQRILARVEEERARLVADFERLRAEVLGRYERAERARVGAERSLRVGRVLRGVQRVLALARQFEGVLGESGLGSGRERHAEMVRGANVVLAFRDLMARSSSSGGGGSRSGSEGDDLGKVAVVRQVRGRVFEDGEARLLDWARKVVREFSAASLIAAPAASASLAFGSAGASTYKDAEETRARFTSAVHVLYLLSPAPRLEGRRKMRRDEFEAEYLLRALQGYLQSSVTSSASGIGRGLGQLPLLERALLEVSARCQNVIALGVLLGGIHAPEHTLLQGREKKDRKKSQTIYADEEEDDMEDELDALNLEDNDEEQDGKENNLLDPLLASLDTSSLASYFWRSLASSLSSKVQEILTRGGVSARTLKSNREIVRTEIRECVLRGSKMPSSLMGHGQAASGKEEVVGNWEREAAVMVGSVVGPLAR